jgi:c-di-GMP-binding flagellar brake protein YcgR
MRKGELLPLRVGQYLKITLYQRHSFFFNTVIVNRKLNPLPVLIVQKPTQLFEIQRRQWVRVPAKIFIRYRRAVMEEGIKPYEGYTIDISGGGILFLTEDPLEQGEIIELEINLPDRRPIFCKAQILRILEKASQKGQMTKAILEYRDLTEGQRDKIVKYVFEKQREWIRRGIL